MRATGNVIRLRPDAGAGSWGSGRGSGRTPTDVRERQGQQVTGVLGASRAMAGWSTSDPFRILTPDQIWQVYQRTPDVRACVDQITRRVSTWNWMVEIVDLEEDDPLYAAAVEAAAGVKRFLAAPNVDGETWQELVHKWVFDLLLYDHGVLEEVWETTTTVPVPGVLNATYETRTNGAPMTELVAINGAAVQPVRDDKGRIVAYSMDLAAAVAVGSLPKTTYLDPASVVSLSLFPTTTGRKIPLIESIVNEVITMLRSSEHLMLAMDVDEIPPGIVVLAGLAGEAAKAAKEDLQRLKGKDHKIRVVTNPDPKAVGVSWVELRHTPKDLTMLDCVDQIRRTIWRLLGVTPVEMGATDAIPRAVGEVQLEIGSSHLVEPILDLTEAKLNARVVAALVGPELAPHVRFGFDRETRMTATDQKAKSEALGGLVQRGILTRNEARAEWNNLPAIDGGDMATIETAVTLVEDIGKEPEPTPGGDPNDPDDPNNGGDGGAPNDDDEAPGEQGSDEATQAGRGGPLPGPVRSTVVRDAGEPPASALPSEWPNAALFDNYRTLSLRRLAGHIEDYTRTVEPLYDRAADDVLAGVQALLGETAALSSEDAARAQAVISRELSDLVVRWGLATTPIYREVAHDARDKAAHFTGAQVVDDWTERAALYQQRAMGYLTAPGGLVSDLKLSLLACVAAVVSESAERTMPVPDERAVRKVPPGLGPTSEPGKLLTALWGAFSAAKERVKNWSGKLVELGNEILGAGLAQGSGEQDEWWYEWVAVGDDRMCVTCSSEGAKGFRPLSQLTRYPGSSTECRARCRCVLVMHTAEEVRNGTAVSLSGAVPGNPKL